MSTSYEEETYGDDEDELQDESDTEYEDSDEDQSYRPETTVLYTFISTG